MKADEVLRQYAEGKRNFQYINIRGKSFQGKDLSGADFSEADIRGTNFAKANLTGAKFIGAKAGLTKRWAIALLCICLVMSGLSGFLALFLGLLVQYIMSPNPDEAIMGWVSLFFFSAFSFFFIYQGINYAVVAGAFAGAVAFAGAFAVAGAKARAFIGVGAFAVAFAVAVAVAFAVTGAVAEAFVVAAAGAFAVAGAFTFAVAGTVAFAGAFAGARAFTGAFLFLLLYVYLGWRAIKGDPRDTWIRTIAVAFAASGGTNFDKANLTDVNFTNANLKNTNFKDAILTRTCFKKTKQLDLARLGETYLNISQVRELVTTGQGQDKNFDRLNLQGVYLKEANLFGASFIEANLQQACLQDANLSDARLVHTLLDQTDLTGANLTGAYIEGWNITTETKLNGVKCDYVYMRLPPDKCPSFIALSPEERRDPNPRRQPANWNEVFKDGDFADFITPMRETLNLYHNKPTDPRLIALAFQQLIDENPHADIELISIEKKGKQKDKLVIRAETAPRTNQAALSATYSKNLEYLQSLPAEAIIALLIERESTIKLLSELIEIKHKSPELLISNLPNFTANQNQGDTMSENTYNLNQAKFGGGFAGTGGTQTGGTFNDYSSKQKLSEAAGEIQKLLKQLELSNPTTTEIDKVTVAAKAAEEIKKNPMLKDRAIAALKSGGTEAFKEAVDHPLVNILVAIIEGWMQGE